MTDPVMDGGRLLTGWGRTAPTHAYVARTASREEVAAAVLAAGPRGVLARGLGRSYGDAAQNAGGTVLDMTALDRVRRVDADTGLVDVDAGVSLDRLLRVLLPLGLTVPVLPGTRQVTVGGAIACDVHGKNHHVDGSFSRHVRTLDLLTADGRVRTLSPDGPDAPLFWATAGGMGLTGVVLGCSLAVRPVETSYVVVESERAPDLDTLMARLSETDLRYRYSVAWFDSISGGRTRGRGVLMQGRDANLDDLDARRARQPLSVPTKRSITVPDALPSGLVNRLTGRLFNEAYFRAAPRRARTDIVPTFGFHHPLDGVQEWNRLYGASGFCQYQLVVPPGAEEVVRAVVQKITESGHASCLNVLKRFGPGTPGPLSFPIPGWTLAVDLPVRPGLDRLLRELDELVLAAHGRVYLAKDARLRPATVAGMYPRLHALRAVLDTVDPERAFDSDLARRLRLRGDTLAVRTDHASAKGTSR